MIVLKRILYLFIFFIIVTGCSAKEDIVWFDTIDEAIEYGLKLENIEKRDIINKVYEKGELFIFFKASGGPVLGVANIAEKNGKYTWFRGEPLVFVNNPLISWETETYSKDTFNIYTGVLESENMTIQTQYRAVTPYIDKTNNIFYYVESTENPWDS